MGYRRVLFVLLAVVAGFALLAKPGEDLDLYLFYGEGCPHCRNEQAFLDKCLEKYPNLNLRRFEVYFDDGNMALFGQVTASLGTGVGGIPCLVIGDETVIGFDKTLTPARIEQRIRQCLSASCPNRTGRLIALHERGLGAAEKAADEYPDAEPAGPVGTITVPLLGEIDPRSFSLPALTVIMGLLDGFNPCAMWALLFLISLLLGMEDRAKRWLTSCSWPPGST